MKQQHVLKSMLCLLMGLVCNAVWAQTEFVEPEVGKYYKLKGDHETLHWLTPDLSGSSIVVSANEEDAAILERTTNGFKVLTTGKYLGLNSGTISYVDTEATVTLDAKGNTEGKYAVKVEGSYMYNNSTGTSPITHESAAWMEDLARFWGFVEVSPFATPENGKYYKIKGDNATHPWLTATVEEGGIDVSNNVADAAIYQFTSNGGLKAIATGKYIGISSSDQISLVDSETSITLSEASNGKQYIKVANRDVRYLHNNHTDYTREGNKDASSQNSWGFIEINILSYTLTDNAGNEYTGYYQGTAGETVPTFTGAVGYTLSDEQWDGTHFTATINFPFPVSKVGNAQSVVISAYNGTMNPGDIKYYVDGTNVKAKPSSDVTEGYDEWEIYPTLTNGQFTFIIKNVGTGYYINTTATSAIHELGTVTVTESIGDATPFVLAEGNRFKLLDYDDLYLSAGSSSTSDQDIGVHGYTSSSSKGGPHYGISNFVYLSNLPCVLTDTDGNTYESTLDATANAFSSWLSFTCITISDKNLKSDGSQLTATVTFPFPVSDDDETNPTMIASFASASYKWYADGTYISTKKNVDPTVANFASYQWAIYPAFNNGVFTFKIKNLGTGTYVYSTSSSDTHDPGTVTLAAEGSDLTLEANNRFKLSTGKYLSLNSSNKSDGTLQYVGTCYGHGGCNLSFPVQQYTVTTDANGNAAIYTPIAVTIPEGVTAYVGKVSANKAAFIQHQVTGTEIPAGTGVVLKGTANTTYIFTETTNAVSAIANNDLEGSSTISGVAYTVQDNDGTVAFLPADATTGGVAYIDMPAGSSHAVTLFDKADLINDVEDFEEGAIYTFVTTRGWMGAKDDVSNVISTAKTSVDPAASATNENFQWTVYKSSRGNYYLYNIGMEKFMGVQGSNNTAIQFADTPEGKDLTFKTSSNEYYPVMFSTNNKGVVNHSTNHGDGLITWTGGWNVLTDGGSNHQVMKVATMEDEALAKLTALVEAYDQELPVKAEVTGLPEDNENTHYGSVRLTSGTATSYACLEEDFDIVHIGYNGLVETTVDFFRVYRGFELTGFSVGDTQLDKSFVLTDDLKSQITEDNPLVAHITFDGTDDITLFSSDDLKSYRIPAIDTTGTGRIIAVSDYRWSLDDLGRDKHGTGTHRIDLVMRYSDDNGKTWSDSIIIAAGSGISGADDCGFGDAAICTKGDTVLVMAAAGDVCYPYATATSHNRAVRLLSVDNGMTWTREDVTEALFIGEDATIKNGYSGFFGSGKLAIDPDFNGTGNARVYGAMLLKKENSEGNYAIYSDDFGKTWGLLGGSQDPIVTQNEPKMEVLPNGQVLISVRKGSGRAFNVFTYGTEEGDKANGVGTWNGVANGCGNGGNSCNGEIYCVDAQKPDGSTTKLLLQSQPYGNDRINVSIWYKEIDSTATYTSAEIAADWTHGIQVSNQLSGYSAMTLQEDGKIGFFFEEAPCFEDDFTKGYSMVYVPLTIESITKGNYYSRGTDLNAATTINVVLTDAEGNTYTDQLTECKVSEVATKLKEKYTYITLGEDVELTYDGTTYTYTNTVTLPFTVSNENTTVWHNIYWPANTNDNGYPIYLSASSTDDTYVPKVTESAAYGSSTYNTLDYADKISWAIYNVDNGFTFKFKNKLTGNYIQVTNVATGDAQNAQYAEEANATAFTLLKRTTETGTGDYALVAEVDGTTGYLCSTSAKNYHYATHYNGVNGKNHAGAWLKFVEAPDFDALIAEVDEALSQDIYGDGLGEYKLGSDFTFEGVKTAMESSGSVKLNDLTNYKEWLESAALNMPKAGQFFRIKAVAGWNDDKPYLGAANSEVSDKTTRAAFVADADESTIFYYDGSQLVSYKTGYYLVNNSNFLGYNGVQTSGAAFTFGEALSGLTGAYKIVFGNRHLNANQADYTDAGGGSTAHGYSFNLEEVDTLPISIHQIGYGTLYAPVPLAIPEGVKAYTGTLDEATDVLTLTKVTTGVIPAATGVMLYREATAEEATNHDFVITTCDETTTSALTGNVATVTQDGTQYTLQTHDFDGDGTNESVAFKLFSGTSINGFKAYLPITSDSGSEANARSIRVRYAGENDDETTEIKTTDNSGQATVIYDLMGRRVEKMEKGVYIVNGKKVIK